ncbi:MAG: response regulator [Terriglobales bacterium]
MIALPSEIQGWSKSAPMTVEDVGLSQSEQPKKNTSKLEQDTIPTLLCIDGHPEGLAVRKVLLEAVGYRVLTAPNGRAGLHIFEKNRVDLVVLDYSMPGLDGEAVARMLHECKPRVPILLLSGAIKNIPGRVLKLMDNFIQKGQPTGVLLSAISELCAAGSTTDAVDGEPQLDLDSQGEPAA